jgi:hypothetical protein
MQLHCHGVAFSVSLVLASALAQSQTTTLPFDINNPTTLITGYGDRVTGPLTGGHNYTGTGTFTPNVELAFGALDNGLTSLLHEWASGYNDLVNVVYASVGGLAGVTAEIVVSFMADPGHRVSLQAFDIGNWGAAITLPYVRISNELGVVLFEELNVALNPNTSPLERNFVLTPAPVGQILTLRISLEGLGGNADNVGLDNVRFGQQAASTIELGTTYCAPAVPNSGSTPARMRVWGQPTVVANDVRLVATSLPHSAFGFFLASRTQGNVANPGGSQGNLCLGGAIGRYVGPGQIKNTGPYGSFDLDIDLTSMPSPTGPVVAQPGQTWNFQAWHRDSVNGVATSNFTDGVSLLLL